MARSSNSVKSQLEDIIGRLRTLVDAARLAGREDALTEMRNLLGSDSSGRKRSSGDGGAKATRRKSTKPRKNPWAGLTPEQHLARVNAIRAGRGLPPREA